MTVRQMLWTGGACLFVGWFLAFLTVLDVLPPTFLLAVSCVCLLLTGTIVGFYGLYEVFRANYKRAR